MGEKKNRHIQSGDEKTMLYSHQRIAGKRSMESRKQMSDKYCESYTKRRKWNYEKHKRVEITFTCR